LSFGDDEKKPELNKEEGKSVKNDLLKEEVV